MDKQALSNYIAGSWRVGDGNLFQTRNPCHGTLSFTGKMAGKQDINDALEASKRAFNAWSQFSLDERQIIIKQFAEQLRIHTDNLARIISEETGKPYWEAKQEVASMINKVDLSIEAYQLRTGFFSYTQANTQLTLEHQPHGIVLVLGPYNFPGHLSNGHIIPTLLAGNTVIFKPSEFTPQTAIAIAELWELTDLPKGTLQLLQGDREVGSQLAGHSQVHAVLFTGSFAAGQALHRLLAGQVNKLLVLEMGGNNPLIVWDEPSIQETVANIIVSSFISTGQRCTCARRLILPQGFYAEKIIDALLNATKNLTIGEPCSKPEPFMGPLINSQAKRKVKEAVENRLALGIKPLLSIGIDQDETGWISPGIYLDEDKVLPDGEVFGPVLMIQQADDFEQAITLANQTAFGLAAGLISPDSSQYALFSKHIRAGVLAWNKPLTGASSRLPFGGIGQSGNHRPSAWYAADYCAYPVASQTAETLTMPTLIPADIKMISDQQGDSDPN